MADVGAKSSPALSLDQWWRFGVWMGLARAQPTMVAGERVQGLRPHFAEALSGARVEPEPCSLPNLLGHRGPAC